MIIVKGKMPRGCIEKENGKYSECERRIDCIYSDNNLINIRPYCCPIVGEIPDEHGDLKDTADIMQRYEHEMVKLKAELPKEQYEQIFRVFHVFIKPWIDQAPIILEASK